MHDCPRCGKQTEGSISLGGITWAICEDCMNKEQEELREERERFDEEYERCLEQGRRYMETGNIDEFRKI